MLPKRKPNRLTNWDYSEAGAYFVTVCTKDRRCILSEIVGALHEAPAVKLSAYGKCVEEVIEKVPDRFGVEIPKYVIMPNHIHLIVAILESSSERAIRESPLHKRSVISQVVGYLKMNASKQIHLLNSSETVWQRSFHDHVIRDERDYERIWQYIDTNPAKWEDDCFYIPQTTGKERHL